MSWTANAEHDDPRPVDGKKVFRVWPDKAPGETGEVPPEAIKNRKPKLGGPVTRVGNVSEPTITLYRAPKEMNTGAAVVVCPGGGYHILAWNLEGVEIAKWLNSIGVNAVVLKYRVPRREGRPMFEAPLQDAQRAIRLTRKHAAEWGIDPKRVGQLGFSAGGHLTATTATNFDRPAYKPVDDADKLSCRPDFSVLIYPAYLLTKENDVNKLAPEVRVSKETPPAILIQTQDDGVKVECAVAYYLALKKAGVPVEMHLYPKGGHGYGLRPTGHDISTWPHRVEDWLRKSGMLGKIE
ncbi:MAG: alpha/beta hydrolase [Pirellulales bacterium]|nr:alpha/beta hydrolase [Pirellulales bacterium]